MEKKVFFFVLSIFIAVNAVFLITRFTKQFDEATLLSDPRVILMVDDVGVVVREKVSRSVPLSIFSGGINDSTRSTFEELYTSLKAPSYFRMKAWSVSAQILWSNISELIGKKFTDNTDLIEALKTGTTTAEATFSSKGDSEKNELFSEYVFNNYLEIYVPIRDSSGMVVGAVEIYRSIDPLVMEMKSAFYREALAVISISVVSYIVIAFVIHRSLGSAGTPAATAKKSQDEYPNI